MVSHLTYACLANTNHALYINPIIHYVSSNATGFDCYVENMEDELLYQKEINVKQFLFTEEEIIDDLSI